MAENKTITLPDVGDFQDIEIIEILVAAGDVVEPEQSIIVLESDKATMEIPSPFAGTIESMLVNVGDRLNEGDQIATLSASDAAAKAEEPQQSEAAVEAEASSAESVPCMAATMRSRSSLDSVKCAPSQHRYSCTADAAAYKLGSGLPSDQLFAGLPTI